jgi:diguanylate cyclase (GGDEF)-like protein
MISSLPKDDLTGLLTQKAFRDAFSSALLQARLPQAEQPLAVGFIDIDNFLAINQMYGHQGGDDLLRAIATHITELVGEQGVVGRYGGDEFAFVLPRMERESAFLLLERIRAAINQQEYPTTRGEVIRNQTISAGVAAFPMDGRTETELMRKADQALYRAKVSGRNQVRLAYEEKMIPKTAHFTQTQLERLSKLAEAHATTDADLLREALDDLLTKYGVNDIES